MLFLPVVVGQVVTHIVGTCLRLGIIIVVDFRTVSICIGIVGSAHVFICHEVYVAGQRTQIVHDVIDAEVIAMNGFVGVSKIIRTLAFRELSCFCFAILQRQVFFNLGVLLVERYLTHTVDGVVGVIDNLRHTVLRPLHHHTATEHAAEVSTLDGIHQTTGIDRQHTVLLPVTSFRVCVNRAVSLKEVRVRRTFKQRVDIISRQG